MVFVKIYVKWPEGCSLWMKASSGWTMTLHQAENVQPGIVTPCYPYWPSFQCCVTTCHDVRLDMMGQPPESFPKNPGIFFRGQLDDHPIILNGGDWHIWLPEGIDDVHWVHWSFLSIKLSKQGTMLKEWTKSAHCRCPRSWLNARQVEYAQRG